MDLLDIDGDEEVDDLVVDDLAGHEHGKPGG